MNRHLIPHAVLTAAFVAMAAWTWGTWPDVLVDFGRELYAPWRLSQGAVLTRDIAWLGGPLSPYLNACWFLAFGVSLRVLVLANLAIAAAALLLIVGLVRTAASRLAATIAGLTFILLFAFAQFTTTGNYNFITPYSHDATHGVVLSCLSLWLLVGFARTGRLRLAAWAGVVLGLVFLTKADVFLAASLGAISALTVALRGPSTTRRRRAAAVVCAAALVPPLACVASLSTVVPPRDALLATVGAWRFVFGTGISSSPFYARISGLATPAASVTDLLAATATWAVIAGAAAAGAWAMRRADISHGAALVAGGGAGMVALAGLAPHINWALFARPFPLLVAALAVILWQRAARSAAEAPSSPEARARRTAQVGFVVFAAVLLGKMVLNTTIVHYGFVLALPATVVVVAALVEWIPSALARRGGHGVLLRGFVLGAWTVVVGVHMATQATLIARKNTLVGRDSDAFKADARGAIVNDLLTAMASLPRDRTVAVLPEGVMLNYLARRGTSTPYVNFMPPELAAFGEDAIVRSFNAAPPDYVVLVHKDTSEYGVRFFGRDFGTALFAWITAHYRQMRVFGAAPFDGERFGVALLERVHEPAPAIPESVNGRHTPRPVTREEAAPPRQTAARNMQ